MCVPRSPALRKGGWPKGKPRGRGRWAIDGSCPRNGPDVDYSRVSCPNTERLCEEAVCIGQSVLLAEEEDMADIARAVEKVLENKDDLN